MSRYLGLAAKLALCAAVIAVPWFGQAFYTELAAKVLVLAIFAMSLDLLVGFTGLVSFGHAAYFGTAAYTVALLTPKYEAANLWLVLPASVAAAALAALAIGAFALRTRGIYFIMVTLAFAQMAYHVVHDTALGSGSDGVYLNFKPDATLFGAKPFDFDNPLALYYFIAALALASYLLLARVLRSTFGRALVGIRSNEHRMRSLGYATYWYKLAAFTLAGAFAGLAGFLYAVLYGFVTPELMAWHQSGNVLLMVILGGMGNLLGAVAGAIAFVGMQELFSTLTKHWQLAMGIVIVLAVLGLPGGLARVPARLREAFGGARAEQGGAALAVGQETGVTDGTHAAGGEGGATDGTHAAGPGGEPGRMANAEPVAALAAASGAAATTVVGDAAGGATDAGATDLAAREGTR